jgi:hypothetical protein
MEYLFDDTGSLFFAFFFKSDFKSLHSLIESPIRSSFKKQKDVSCHVPLKMFSVRISYVGDSIHGKLNLFAFLMVNK